MSGQTPEGLDDAVIRIYPERIISFRDRHHLTRHLQEMTPHNRDVAQRR